MSETPKTSSLANYLKGTGKDLAIRSASGLLGPDVGRVAYDTLSAPRGTRASAFSHSITRASLGAIASATGIHRTSAVLGSSRLSTSTAGLGIHSSTSPTYTAINIEVPKLTRETKFESLERVDRPSPYNAYRENFTVEEKINYFRDELNFLKGQSAAVQRNFQKVDMNVRKVDERITLIDQNFRKALESFNKQQDRQRNIAEQNARSGHAELRRQEVAANQSQFQQSPAFTTNNQKGSSTNLLAQAIESVVKGITGAASGAAMFAGGALTAAGGAAITNFLKRNADKVLKPIISGISWKAVGMATAMNIPAAIALILTQKDSIEALAKDFDAAKTAIDKLQASEVMLSESKTASAKDTKISAIARQKFEKSVKDGNDPYTSALHLLNELQQEYKNPTKRDEALARYLEDINSLKLTPRQKTQLKNKLPLGIQNQLNETGDALRARRQRRNRLDRSKQMNLGGPRGNIGAKGPLVPDKSTAIDAMDQFSGSNIITPEQYQERNNELNFAEKVERFQIEQSKSEFLKFGKLPEGFEFLSGHMGRLGNPAAVMARGVMPFSGSPITSFGGGYSGGGSIGTPYNYSAPTGIGGPSSGPSGTSGAQGPLSDKHPLAQQRIGLGGNKLNQEQKLHFYSLMMAEIGGKATDEDIMALMETPYNRGMTEKDENIMSNLRADYYQPLRSGEGRWYNHWQKQLRNDPKLFERLDKLHNKVLQGSNYSNLATQNSSAGVAANARKTQTVTAKTSTGETLSRKDRAEYARIHGAGTVRNTQKWVNETNAAIEKYKQEQQSGQLTKESTKKFTDKEFKKAQSMGPIQSKGRHNYAFPLETGSMLHRGHGRTSQFGYARGRLHAGVDLYDVDPETKELGVGNDAPVFSPEDGEIMDVRTGRGLGTQNRAGNWIEIRDKRGMRHRFLHTHTNPINPDTGKPWKRGDKVKKGQMVTYVTGSGTDYGRTAARMGGDLNATKAMFDKRGWGSTNMPHLHYELRMPNGKLIDPALVYPEFRTENKGQLFGRIEPKEMPILPTQRGEVAFSNVGGLKSPITNVNPAMKEQLDGMDELERAAALAGSDYTRPKVKIEDRKLPPREENAGELKSWAVAPKPQNPFEKSELEKRWLGVPKDNRPSPNAGPISKLPQKKQIDSADRTELKAMTAAPPKKVEPPPVKAAPAEAPAPAAAPAEGGKEASPQQAGPGGVTTKQETGVSNKSESINPQIDPSSGYQPESEPASHGSGGYGSFGRCFV